MNTVFGIGNNSLSPLPYPQNSCCKKFFPSLDSSEVFMSLLYVPGVCCCSYRNQLLAETSSEKRTKRESKMKRCISVASEECRQALNLEEFPKLPLGGLFMTLSKIGIHQVAFKSFKNTESLILRFPATGCSVPATL